LPASPLSLIGARLMANIIPLDDIDPVLVEDLLDRAFEPERRQRTAYKLREGLDFLPALSFAALDENDHVTGTIQCWPVGLTDPKGRMHPLIMVGPVAVLPESQGGGYGKALMQASLSAISPEAPLPQVMIGDAEYYGRFWGFSADHTSGWKLPGPWEPRRLLVRCDNPAVLPLEGMLGPWNR
jgi:predicted N-acetyltransferase YhbS